MLITRIKHKNIKYNSDADLSWCNCIAWNEKFWKYVLQVPVKWFAIQSLPQLFPSWYITIFSLYSQMYNAWHTDTDDQIVHATHYGVMANCDM